VLTVTDSEFLSIVVMPSSRGRPHESLKIQPPSLSETPASIAATVNAARPPLKSSDPRPSRKSPLVAPPKGSKVHSSGSTPTVSA
jgi:hypothetical protein